MVKGQKDDRVEISWREGWFCTFPHPVTQAVCVFALLQRQKSWDRAACGEEEHTGGKKGGKQWPGKRGRQGWRLLGGWREGKAGFAVFRDGSPGIVLSALAVL